MGFHKKVHHEQNSLVQNKFFKDNYLVVLLQELEVMVCNLVDGIACSLFLGSTGIAAYGIMNPFFSAAGIISALLFLGTQKICMNAYCTGNKKKAEEAFNTAFFSAIFISITFVTILLFFSDPIIKCLGGSGNSAELYEPARQYLFGLCIGTPFIVLVPVLTPISQLNGQKRYINISLIVIIAIDSLLDFLVGIFGFGMFGMGVSTSIAQFFGFLILVIPLYKQRKIRLNLKSIRFRTLGEIGHFGLPKVIRRCCDVIRPVTFNKLVLALAGTVGMSAMSIRNGLSRIFECTGAALGATVIILVILFISENNIRALQQVKKKTLKFIVFPISFIGVLIFIFAELLVKLYGPNDSMMIEMAVSAVRFVSVDIVLFALYESVSCYWQGIGEIRTANIIMLLYRLGFPLMTVFVLGRILGTLGIWMSFPVSTFLSILSFYVPSLFKYHRFTLFPIPKECAMQDISVFECTIEDTTIREISEKTQSIQNFCLKNGVDQKSSFYLALYFEEIVEGIFENGIFKKGERRFVNYFIRILDSQIVMRVFYNSEELDVVSFFHTQTFDKEHPENHLGLRIVMNTAEDIRYACMYGLNCLTISL